MTSARALTTGLGIALSLGALALPTPPASAAQKQGAVKPVLRPFLGSLEQAKEVALHRNVPLLVHAILEGEEQNDEYREAILPDAELTAECQRAVVIVANNGEHALKKVTEEVDGVARERQVCSVYPVFERCEQHRATWDPVYFEFHDAGGELRCPQAILLAPAGAIAWRHDDGSPPEVDDVIAALKDARKAAGKGLSAAELGVVKDRLEKGRRAAATKNWPAAWSESRAVLELVEAGPLGAEAAAGNAQALEEMRAELASAVASLVPGSAGAGWRKLGLLSRSFEGTPLAKDVQAAMQRAERDKAIRAEIDAAKLELEAQELWAEAQRLFEAGDARKAERAVRRLVRAKYRETETGKLAREKHPEWAAEEDAKGK